MLESSSPEAPVEGAPVPDNSNSSTRRRNSNNNNNGNNRQRKLNKATGGGNNNNNVDNTQRNQRRQPVEDFETVVVEPVEPCFLPDDAAFNESQAALKKRLAEGRIRSQEIDAQIAQTQLKRNAALEVLKPTAQLLRTVKGHKQEIYSHLEANKSRQDRVLEIMAAEKEAIKQMKRNLTFKSEEAIDEAVNELESSISQSGLSAREEKSIISRIRAIKAKKSELKAVNDREQEFANRPDEIAPLKAEKEKLYQQLTEFKNQEKGLHSQVESLRSELDVLNKQIQDLKESKTLLYEDRKVIKGELDQLVQDRDLAYEQYAKYQRWLKYKKYMANKKIREEQEALRKQQEDYRKQQEAEREAELAKLDPYQEQKDLCSAMEAYLQRFVVDNNMREREEADVSVVAPDIDDDDWGYFAQSQKKSSSKTSRRTKRQQRKSVDFVGITHTPDVFADFAKLKVQVPMTVQDVPQALKKVQDLKKFYNEAPHPKKLKEAEDQKKRALEGLKERRAFSKVTLPLFEAERQRRLQELKEQEQLDFENLLQERTNAVAAVILLAECERQSRLQEERRHAMHLELTRKLMQKYAAQAMQQEQAERVAALRRSLLVEELERMEATQRAIQAAEQERFQRLSSSTHLDDRREAVMEAVAAAEQEQRRRILEEEENRSRFVSDVSVHEIVVACEEERRRRIMEVEAEIESERAERISQVIAAADEERERRIATALESLEDGEPVLVAFLRDNAPVINSHL